MQNTNSSQERSATKQEDRDASPADSQNTNKTEDAANDIMPPLQPHPLQNYLRQAALQAAAVFTVLSLIWPYFIFQDKAMPWREVSLSIGIVALLFACLMRQPWWWRLIHGAFVPMLWAVSTLPLHPGWFMLAFITTLLISRGALTGQIPLYFSNRRCAQEVAKLIAEQQGKRVIDLGAGIGSMIIPLAQYHPKAEYTGIENAPIPWLLGALRARKYPNCQWHWGNFWKTDLTDFDVVYAFLSPAPMSRLWQKIHQEMRPGSLLISNSFQIPGIEPSQIVDVDDARGTRLFCYQC